MKKIIYWIPYVPIIGLIVVGVILVYDASTSLKNYKDTNYCFSNSNIHNILSCSLQLVSVIIFMTLISS